MAGPVPAINVFIASLSTTRNEDAPHSLCSGAQQFITAAGTASVEPHFAPSWSFAAKFDGKFASGSQTYAGTGTLRTAW
jgi:hypothetical protein